VNPAVTLVRVLDVSWLEEGGAVQRFAAPPNPWQGLLAVDSSGKILNFDGGSGYNFGHVVGSQPASCNMRVIVPAPGTHRIGLTDPAGVFVSPWATVRVPG
jgi:hypothetical protein